ncbi:MAG: hypothetical protein V1770_04200 [bacterium]
MSQVFWFKICSFVLWGEREKRGGKKMVQAKECDIQCGVMYKLTFTGEPKQPFRRKNLVMLKKVAAGAQQNFLIFLLKSGLGTTKLELAPSTFEEIKQYVSLETLNIEGIEEYRDADL